MNLSAEEDDAKGEKTGEKQNQKRTSTKETSVNLSTKEETGSSRYTEKLQDEQNEKRTSSTREESENSDKVEDLSEPSPLASHYFRQVAHLPIYMVAASSYI